MEGTRPARRESAMMARWRRNSPRARPATAPKPSPFELDTNATSHTPPQRLVDQRFPLRSKGISAESDRDCSGRRAAEGRTAKAGRIRPLDSEATGRTAAGLQGSSESRFVRFADEAAPATPSVQARAGDAGKALGPAVRPAAARAARGRNGASRPGPVSPAGGSATCRPCASTPRPNSRDRHKAGWPARRGRYGRG
jgi:hypothetical protein